MSRLGYVLYAILIVVISTGINGSFGTGSGSGGWGTGGYRGGGISGGGSGNSGGHK